MNIFNINKLTNIFNFNKLIYIFNINKLISIINLYFFCVLQTDNSTETFWESGDEDRNKTKTVTVTCFMKAYPKAIYVHVDNTRDIAVSFTSPFFSHILISCIIFSSDM